MKKRFAAMLLIVCLCTSMLFTSCGKSMYDKYKEACEKTNNLEYIDADIDMNIKVKSEGMTIEMPVTMSMKGQQKDGELVNAVVGLSMKIMGQETIMSMYMADGYSYVDSDVIKYKQEIGSEDAVVDESMIDIGNFFADLKEDTLKDYTMAKDAGATTVSVTVSGDLVKNLIKTIVGSMGDSYGIDDSAFDAMTIADTDLSYTINKEGYISKYSIETSIDMTVEETSVSADLDMSMTINDPGKTVTITPPSDLSEYKTMDEINAEAAAELDYSEDLADEGTTEILTNLYDLQTGKRVENYNEAYDQMVSLYGKTLVDMTVEYFEASMALLG